MKGVLNSRVVYVVGAAEFPVKIGVADDVNKRLAGLQTGCPDELFIYHAVKFPFGMAQSVEAAAHRMLEDKRRRGEWFNVHKDEAIALVDRLKVEMLPEYQFDRRNTDLIGWLHARYEMAADARRAVMFYRERLQAKDEAFVTHANGYILKRCGTAAYAGFSLVIAQRKPLTRLNQAERQKAELVLVRAINALVDFWHDFHAIKGEREAARKYGSLEDRRRAFLAQRKAA